MSAVNDHAGVLASLAKRLASLERAASRAPDQTWTQLSFAANWTNYGGTWEEGEYRKINDVVQLRGLVKHTAGGGPATNIGLLPVGYRPPKSLIFVCEGYTSGLGYRGYRVDVYNDGWVFCSAPGATGQMDYLSLCQIGFSVTP